jgi:tetratricopeptide (TPR) repeat protein
MATLAAGRAKPRRRIVRESVLDTPDPLEIAMAAAASGKPLPDVARRVLEEQVHLIHAQCAELKLRQIGERVRAALWAILAIAAAAILALIIAIIIRASRSDALIVQSFRVPPSLAAKGLTGEVVATQVLDKLAEMQTRTDSGRAASSYANNWENDLKIDIPNTGATTDQIWRLLRGWLGKETRISGEVVDTGNGMALTVRVGSEPGHRFESKDGKLDTLVTQGAESIYQGTQAYRYAVYLARTDRPAERDAVLKRLSTDPSPIERKWAYAGLTYYLNADGKPRAAVAMAERALRIDPNMHTALLNASSAQSELGHDQAAVDLIMREQALSMGKEYDPEIIRRGLCGTTANLGERVRDPALIDRAVDCFDRAPTVSDYVPLARAYAAIYRHDLLPALAFRQQPTDQIPSPDAEANAATVHFLAQLQRPPGPGLAAALEEYRAANAKDASLRGREPVNLWPYEANALSLLGRRSEAQTLIDRTPLDCYECVRVRGLVAQRAGQPANAQRWFAEAARQGPRLAPAFADWGRLLAEHRRFASAEVKLAEAVRLAPNWADPLKIWGDSLAAQGKAKEAVIKYDAALKLAPNWQQLRQTRDRVASH